TGQLVAGRYRVGRALGRGGGGRVFLAEDAVVRRAVVLKEVPLDAPERADVALREARAAGSVGHPNVVAVHDVVRRARSLLLVQEHVQGGSLADAVAARGRLPAGEGARMLEDALRGLAAVHARGVVHRDLKPANLLVAADGAVKIADFGLARLAAERETREAGRWGVSGTPAFMAPEQLAGEAATARTDVHAVGLVARACFEPLPPAVEAVVARALERDPAARWADAGEMLDALRRARAAEP
ncbi:MAG TPA: serine/threonine-protein kinase, partial [Candidatus Thermoplasmatota archaeon]|nr:serine/threonine-protein kinase [Candidatus Thermoplasmatota archaeon]